MRPLRGTKKFRLNLIVRTSRKKREGISRRGREEIGWASISQKYSVPLLHLSTGRTIGSRVTRKRDETRARFHRGKK